MDSKWITRFYKLAEEVASWSKDPKAKVGAVLVSPDKRQFSYGYNGFPAGVEDDERLRDRTVKLNLMVHAELNALLNARQNVTGWTLFVNKAPCVTCACAIAQAGISAVVTKELDLNSSWTESCIVARSILLEAGVTYTETSHEL